MATTSSTPAGGLRTQAPGCDAQFAAAFHRARSNNKLGIWQRKIEPVDGASDPAEREISFGPFRVLAARRLKQRKALLALWILALWAAPSFAQNVEKAPPPAPYKKVSELVKLPDFLPGIGTLYVDPKTLPDGPFLAYDHQRRLVSTIYMIPIRDLDAHNTVADLRAPGGRVDHVSLYYNAGHPGVPEPHYHIVLWHVPKAEEQLVAE